MFLGIGITRNSIILLVSVLFVFAKGSDKLPFVNNVVGGIVLSYLNFFDVCEMQLLNQFWNKKLTETYISAIEDSIHRGYGDTRLPIPRWIFEILKNEKNRLINVEMQQKRELLKKLFSFLNGLQQIDSFLKIELEDGTIIQPPIKSVLMPYYKSNQELRIFYSEEHLNLIKSHLKKKTVQDFFIGLAQQGFGLAPGTMTDILNIEHDFDQKIVMLSENESDWYQIKKMQVRIEGNGRALSIWYSNGDEMQVRIEANGRALSIWYTGGSHIKVNCPKYYSFKEFSIQDSSYSLTIIDGNKSFKINMDVQYDSQFDQFIVQYSTTDCKRQLEYDDLGLLFFDHKALLYAESRKDNCGCNII